MSQHHLPPIEIINTTYAYEACTHFLNPRGGHNHRFTWVKEPTTDATITEATLPNRNSEIVWIDFNAHPTIEIKSDGEDEVLYGKRHHIGEIHLATMWKEGEYSFKTLDELIEAPELPVYTAAWLARYMNGTGRKTQGEVGLASGLSELGLKEPLTRLLTPAEVVKEYPNLKGENFIKLKNASLKKRCEDLGQRAVNEFPHLEGWYKARGVIK